MSIKKNVADGAIMKNIREKKGISLHDMAKKLNLPRGDNELADYETCCRTPSFEKVVVKFCNVTGTPLVNFYQYMPAELYDFGMRLRQLRKMSGITQGKLASMTGTTQTVVCRYERGTVEPKIKFIHDAAAALKLKPDELYYLVSGKLPPGS